MSRSISRPEASQLIHSALVQVGAQCQIYTYPLFAADERDRPELFASSVLLECDGFTVLVTAAHAIFQITEYGSQVHVGTLNSIFPLGNFVKSSPNGADDFDLAAVLVSEELLPNFRKALPLNRTTDGMQVVPHMRCIHGYPISKNKTRSQVNELAKKFSPKSFTYAGASMNIDLEYVKYKKDKTYHAALKYQRQGRNQEGEIVTPPSPTGISGGGLWLVPDIHKATDVYLEGIAIEFHKKGPLIFATRIEHVVAFVRSHILPRG